MQLEWVLIVTFANSPTLPSIPATVPIATLETYEACAEARAGFLLLKNDKAAREFFLVAGTDARPSGAKCLPVGSEAAIRDFMANHPEAAVTQRKAPVRKPGPSN